MKATKNLPSKEVLDELFYFYPEGKIEKKGKNKPFTYKQIYVRVHILELKI